MKKILSFILLSVLSIISLQAKSYVKAGEANSKADNIIGKYYIVDKQGTTSAVIYKVSDGTYRCKTVGGKPEYDENGNVKLDEYNPEPSLRNIPIHEAVIISGLKYNAEKKQWEGGKIHNPINKVESANCTVDFVDDGKTLRVFGNLMGIGKNVYWQYRGK